MKRLFQNPIDLLLRIHRSERGAEGLEKLLIIAAIILPLLALLITFRKYLVGWATGKWDEVTQEGDGPASTSN